MKQKCDHPHIEDMGEKWTFCEDVGCDGYIHEAGCLCAKCRSVRWNSGQIV